MEQRLQAIQNVYFEEYKAWANAHQDEAMRELERWEANEVGIIHMTLPEQAEFADYVTRKMCSEQPANIIAALAHSSFQHPIHQRLECCAIGNLAKVLLTAKNQGTDVAAYEDSFRETLQQQEAIRRQPGPGCAPQ